MEDILGRFREDPSSDDAQDDKRAFQDVVDAAARITAVRLRSDPTIFEGDAPTTKEVLDFVMAQFKKMVDILGREHIESDPVVEITLSILFHGKVKEVMRTDHIPGNGED